MKDLMEQKDKLGRPVVVVTDVANRPGCIRAERCGRLAMVLSRCDRPVRCLDGKLRTYCVETAMLSADDDNELACVQNNEYTYYKRDQVLPVLTGKALLFDTLAFD